MPAVFSKYLKSEKEIDPRTYVEKTNGAKDEETQASQKYTNSAPAKMLATSSTASAFHGSVAGKNSRMGKGQCGMGHESSHVTRGNRHR